MIALIVISSWAMLSLIINWNYRIGRAEGQSLCGKKINEPVAFFPEFKSPIRMTKIVENK